MPTASQSASGAYAPHRTTAATCPTVDPRESLEPVQRLIERALGDLRDARRRSNIAAAGRAERRMNALLDLFAKRTRTSRLAARP